MRPTKLDEIWPYYWAVVSTSIGRIFRMRTMVSDQIHRPMRIRSDGVVFDIRPGTVDLAMAALSADPLRVTRFFRPKTGDVVVDIGANVGGYALRAARVAKRVIAVEPEASNYRQLLENIRLSHLENVTPLQVAISDRSGQGELHLADSGTHSLEAKAWGKPTGKTVAVQLITLDELIMTQGVRRIDWLKIDVERHELSALRGASHSLAITEHLILEFEVSIFSAISGLLRRQGLEVIWYDRQMENSVLLAARGFLNEWHDGQRTSTL
jgi:FkbM family methyltransferase